MAPVCCPQIVMISPSFPRSGSRCLASLRAGSCLTTPARDGRVLQCLGQSTLNYHHHWILTLISFHQIEAISKFNLHKPAMKIKWINHMDQMDSAFPWLLQLFNMPLKIECCKSFYHWFMLYPEENSNHLLNLHVSLSWFKGIMSVRFLSIIKPRHTCI